MPPSCWAARHHEGYGCRQDRAEAGHQRGGPLTRTLSVEAFKLEWDAKLARRESAKQEARSTPAELGPPEDGEVWVTTRAVAALLGVSTSWVRDLARSGRLPHYAAPDGRRYFRRDHMEHVVAIR